MKILICNLPGPVLKSGSRWYNYTKGGAATLKYYPYPWFLGYATSLLKSNGVEARLRDYVALEYSFEEALKDVENYNPTHIVFDTAWSSRELDISFLSAISNNIQKIAVGNYATNYPEECVDLIGADIAIYREFEFALLDYLKNGTIQKNFITKSKRDYESPELIQDLDKFPFPEREDTPFEYFNEPSCYGKNIVMITSRGCRLDCSFCNIGSMYGGKGHRVRSPENIVDEIQMLQSKYKFDEIYFDDDNIVSDKRTIDGMCKEIIRRGVKIKYCAMGDGFVKDDTLELLAKSGCATYKWGAEHLDDDVLALIPKKYKGDRQIELIHKIRELGMMSYMNIIIGLPGSTREKDLSMMKRIIEASPDLIQIAIAIPYPGTRFYREAQENNWLVSHDSKDYDVTGRTPISYPNYSSNEIQETFYECWRMWYKHVARHKPKTLWFFFSSEVKRNGLFNTLNKSLHYLAKTIFKIEHTVLPYQDTVPRNLFESATKEVNNYKTIQIIKK